MLNFVRYFKRKKKKKKYFLLLVELLKLLAALPVLLKALRHGLVSEKVLWDSDVDQEPRQVGSFL